MHKMTDEELSKALEEIRKAGGGSMEHRDRVARVAAHIAALTAERDEADRQRMAANTAIQGVQDEVNTLRERVQAQTTYKEAWRKRAEAAESTLAAIRQRAGELTAMGLREVFSGRWAQASSEFIKSLGEDAMGAGQSLHCCGTTTDAHLDGCPHAQTMAMLAAVSASPEPTTDEAFATVRRFVERHDVQCGSLIAPVPCDCGAEQRLAALSLLERRMGAMGRTIREAPHDETCAAPGTTAPCNCWKASALADAPPVFTLEEVERAVNRAIDIDAPTRNGVLCSVRDALRKP